MRYAMRKQDGMYTLCVRNGEAHTVEKLCKDGLRLVEAQKILYKMI